MSEVVLDDIMDDDLDEEALLQEAQRMYAASWSCWKSVIDMIALVGALNPFVFDDEESRALAEVALVRVRHQIRQPFSEDDARMVAEWRLTQSTDMPPDRREEVVLATALGQRYAQELGLT